MFGPVMISMRSRRSARSFGTKGSSLKPLDDRVPARRDRRAASATSSGCDQRKVSARSASAASASISAIASAVRCSGAESVDQLLQYLVVELPLACQRLVARASTLSSKLLSSGVMKRSALRTVWRRR
jgi:hypothetical protein